MTDTTSTGSDAPLSRKQSLPEKPNRPAAHLERGTSSRPSAPAAQANRCRRAKAHAVALHAGAASFSCSLQLHPVVNLFRYSLTSWDGFSPTRPYVGLKNYVDLFTRPELFEVFFVCLYYLAASVVQLVIALYFATC